MKVKIFFFVLLIVASLSLNAQDKEWFCSVPGDPSLLEPPGAVYSISHQTQNYLCWSSFETADVLNVFNGSKWRKIKMNDTILAMSMLITIDEQNDSFIFVKSESKYDYVWLYNGVQWQMINKLKFLRNNTHYVTAIKFYRNKIYVALQIDSVNASLLEYDFKLNTTKTVSTFQRKAIKTVHEISLLMELSVRNNRLYISGAYDSANHQNSQGYGYYDGSSFKSLNIFPSFPSNFSIVKQLDKSIFVVERIYDITSNDISNYRMFFIRNDSVIGDISRDLYTKHFKKPTYGTLLHYDFQVYLQNGFIHIFGDFPSQHFAFDLTNRRWHAEKVLFIDAKSFLFKNNRYVFNSEATLPYPTQSLGCFVLKPTAFVSGYAFADIDDNCVRTSNDVSISKQWIKLEGANITTATMSKNDGFYGMTLDPGNYTFKSSEPTFSTNICSTGTIQVDTFAQYTRDVSHNFIAPFSTTGDINVELFGSFLRRGMKCKLTIVLDNVGKPEYTVAPCLNFDHRLQFVSSSMAYLSKNQKTIVFDSIKVKKFKPIKIDLVFYLPPDLFATGNTIRFVASVDSSNTEVSYDNNIKIYDSNVIGPYDPNHIVANVEGAVKGSPKHINYTVEFQNLGTDTAFNVTIVDTIPSKFDVYSIKLLSASSDDIYATIKGSVVSFKFKQIRLTPKAFDEAKSKGFISFSIELKDTLKIGEMVKNKAGIYFDYEAVVTTNQSNVERVRYGLSVKSSELKNKVPFTSYPNPSAKQLSIQTSEGKAIESIKFFSITGQELLAETSNGIDFDISTWPNGLFLIVVKIDGQTYTSLNSKLVH